MGADRTTRLASCGFTRALAAALLASLAACRADGERRAALGGPSRALAPHRPAIDAEHYALDLEIDAVARTISGRASVRFVARRDGVARVELDLAGLEVRSVRDARGAPLAFERVGEVLAVELPRALARGEAGEVEVEYGGAPRKGLWFAAERDGVPTQAYTHGQPDESRWWFPCVDHPSDRATSEVAVTMPAGWRALAPGELVERGERAGRAFERWRMHVPHPAYLVSLYAGEIELREASCGGLPLAFAASPRHADLIDGSFAETCGILRWLEELCGLPYPFPKYAQACAAGFPFGGMENASATTLSETALVDERLARDAPPTALLVHEAAHQWFGDLVTCAGWDEVWLNEGFATYCAALYVERTRGPGAFGVEMRAIRDAWLERDVGANRRPLVWESCRDPQDLFFSGHAYQGGATRLHLLRSVVGDEAFFRGVRLYLARNQGRSVTSEDLRLALEESSGVALGELFDQWVRSRGHPVVEFAWAFDPRLSAVRARVVQTQDPSDGTPRAFRFPLEISVRTKLGARTSRFAVERRAEEFLIPCDGPPLAVEVDPRGWIPMRLSQSKTAAEWLAILRASNAAVSRADAARVLGEALGSAGPELDPVPVERALAERLDQDDEPAVRAAAARALAPRSEREAVRVALARAASRDAEAAVRVAALEALGPPGPDRALANLAAREIEAGWSWATIAAAAGLSRRAEPEGAYERLERLLARPSPHGVLAARLVPEIADTGDPRAPALLRALAADPAAEDAPRAAAITALAARARGSRADAPLFASLLDSPSPRVRREAIAALALLRDPEGLDALARLHARSVLPTERRAIEAALAAEAARGG